MSKRRFHLWAQCFWTRISNYAENESAGVDSDFLFVRHLNYFHYYGSSARYKRFLVDAYRPSRVSAAF